MVSECCQYSIITPDPWEQESFWWELTLPGWKEALPVNRLGRDPFIFLEEAAGFAWCQWPFNQKAQEHSPSKPQKVGPLLTPKNHIDFNYFSFEFLLRNQAWEWLGLVCFFAIILQIIWSIIWKMPVFMGEVGLFLDHSKSTKLWILWRAVSRPEPLGAHIQLLWVLFLLPVKEVFVDTPASCKFGLLGKVSPKWSLIPLGAPEPQWTKPTPGFAVLGSAVTLLRAHRPHLLRQGMHTWVLCAVAISSFLGTRTPSFLHREKKPPCTSLLFWKEASCFHLIFTWCVGEKHLKDTFLLPFLLDKQALLFSQPKLSVFWALKVFCTFIVVSRKRILPNMPLFPPSKSSDFQFNSSLFVTRAAPEDRGQSLSLKTPPSRQ